MKGTLMHKRIQVADMELDDVTGMILKINKVYTPEHAPVGVIARNGMVDRGRLNEWWLDRSIPASRSGIREALETLELSDAKQLLLRCLGFSLSDQYWICPEGSDMTWDQLNFFQNAFSEDIGDVLFGMDKRAGILDFSSPDNTSDGNLKKRWKIADGKRYLIKGGSAPFRQQPFNEVIASKIMEALNINHIPYSILWENGAPYSICEDFVTPDTELIPAWRIIQTQKKENSVSVYQHFVNCARELGIPNVVPFLERMIVVDYIIANEDRHLNNFGALRDAQTLKWLGMAPVYDSGSSLGYDKMASEIRQGYNIVCKPFKKHHDEQLKLVTDFSWIDFQSMSNIREKIFDIFSGDPLNEFMDENRIRAIADTVEERIEHVRKLAAENAGKLPAPAAYMSAEDDVTENIAKAYDES